jgi:zinc protease
MRGSMKTYFIGVLIIGIPILLAACGAKVDPNKLTSELLPLDGNPLVSFRVLVKVGSANDPSGKEGLCQLTWSMLAGGGSKSMTIRQITEKFYPMAASLSLSMDKERTVFEGTVHKDNLEGYYAIINDMLLDPGFRADDFNRIKTNQLNFVEKTLINNMDETFGKEILNLMLYEGHPYGHHEAGTAESVAGLTLDDVNAFYKEHFVQGNIVLGLVGGYPADFAARVAADFGKLPRTFTPHLSLPPAHMPKGLEFVIAEKPTPATAISMGFPIALTKADKDFFALWIAGSHFGEHRQHVSLLFQKIREERGQNYGDYAYLDHFIQGRDKFPAPNHVRQQQYFSIWIRPLANSNRHFVIRQALRELKKLVDDGLSEERFQLVRTYLLNYTKLYAQTIGERLGWQMDSVYYGYPDFLAEAQNVLPQLTRADVNRAIKKYLNFENVCVAVITPDAEGLRNDLVSNAPSPIKYANPNMPREILDEDTVIQEYPLSVKADKVRIAPAAEFFQKRGVPEK